MNNKYLLEIKTVQSSNIRTLFEVLKEILVELNLLVSNEGIKVTALNNAGNALVLLNLSASKFEYYYCENTVEKPLVLGIDTVNTLKLMKTIQNPDTVSLYVERSNPHNLIIRRENSEKNSLNIYRLELRDIEADEIQFPFLEIDCCEVIMPSNDFQKICRDYNTFGTEHLEIKSVNEQLIFSGKCDFSYNENIIGSSDNTTFVIKGSEILQGTFPVKYLLLFTKATNLSSHVQIILKNDYPLILSYNVGTLGHIKFFISAQALAD